MYDGCKQYRQFSRRQLLRAGGASLFGLTLPQFFRAKAQAAGRGEAKAKSMILVWLNGGPPHQDMFDMKPDTPPPFGSELRPAKSNVPGIEFCELMPKLSRIADKFSILRSVSIGNERWEHSGGLYWLTGNPRNKDTEKYPTYGNVMAKVRPAPQGLPTYVSFGPYRDAGDVHQHYLGPAYNPLTFIPGDARDEVASMLVPPAQLELPELQRRENLRQALNTQMRRLDAAGDVIGALDQFHQDAFDLLRSGRLRQAVDVKGFSSRDLDRYGNNADGMMMLAARKMVEIGVPSVFVPFAPGWDFHGSVTNACKSKLPKFDAALSALLTDLDVRGLLDSTIVMVLGEMGRGPIYKDSAYSGPPGRDHWATTQFVLVAGGGFKNGMVLGATDRRSQYVIDKYYSPVSLGRTVYHLLGIDPDEELYTTSGRPVKIITEGAPLIREIIA